MTITKDLSLEWILSSIGLTLAFLIGLWQYQRSQRQDKIALLLPLINEFETDEKLQIACSLLDYDAGTFIYKDKEYNWTNADLLSALKVVEVDQDWPPLQEVMREALDRFFDFFCKLSSFIEVKLLCFKDLKFFYYYLELLTGIESYKGDLFHTALNRYLEAYRFEGCLKCCALYAKLPWQLRQELFLSDKVGSLLD